MSSIKEKLDACCAQLGLAALSCEAPEPAEQIKVVSEQLGLSAAIDGRPLAEQVELCYNLLVAWAEFTGACVGKAASHRVAISKQTARS